MIDDFINKGIINSYKLIAGETTFEGLLEKESMQSGCVSQHNPTVFFINPEEEPDNTDLDTMIDYFISTEEYEKCAVLTKLKK